MKRFVTGQARGQATLFPDRLEDFIAEDNPVRVIDAEEMQRIKALEPQMLAAEDQQLLLTDPDARAMKGRGGNIVAYNVQAAVETTQHLIVAHEVTPPAAIKTNWRRWPRRPVRRCTPRSSQPPLIAATTKARSYWLVRRRASPPTYPGRTPPITRPKGLPPRGLPLPTRGQRVPLPCRRTPDLVLQKC